MTFAETLALLTILLQVTFLEGVLSLDNAAVLGAVVLRLPEDKPVPWPRALRHIGKALNPLLGKQRTAGLRVGLIGAYLGRGLMLLMASFVIRNPWLQLIGAAYLLKISISALGAPNEEDGEESAETRSNAREKGFWATVLMVELMDLAFSLDNVVVVVSLSSELWVVMLGVAIGILAMRFAAGLFTTLIEKIPPLSTAAYVLVFNIGVEFILTRLLSIEVQDFTRFAINIGTLLVAVAYAKIPLIQTILTTPLRLFRTIFCGLDWIIGVILSPFDWAMKKLGALLRSAAQEPKSGD